MTTKTYVFDADSVVKREFDIDVSDKDSRYIVTKKTLDKLKRSNQKSNSSTKFVRKFLTDLSKVNVVIRDTNENDEHEAIIEAAQAYVQHESCVVKVVTVDPSLVLLCKCRETDSVDPRLEFAKAKDDREDLYVDRSVIDKLHKEGECELDAEEDVRDGYITLRCEDVNTAMARVTSRDGKKIAYLVRGDNKIYGISPKNREQSYILDALMDESAKFVAATGPAGTGKTLFAIAAGFDQLVGYGQNQNCQRYNKIIVTRSLVSVERDVGYLPGTIDEKMLPWLGSIRDNISYLSNKNSSKGAQQQQKVQKDAKNSSSAQFSSLDPYFSIMQEKGMLEISSIAHVRGRSFSKCYIIVDEAQNLTMHEIKTLVTRVSDDSKIVLIGDTDQVDDSRLTGRNNDFLSAIQTFKDVNLFRHVNVKTSVRGRLAAIASKIL